MMSALEAAVSRKLALKAMFANVSIDGPFAGQVFFELFDRVSLFDPIERRFAVALPDYHSARPDQSAAIDYATALIRRDTENAGAYCVACDFSPESGEAWDVSIACGADILVVTVWNETREDGSKFIYGEW